MASDLQHKPATGKFESFVDARLNAVRRRLRALDVGAAALLGLAVVLGYAVLMAIFDLAVGGTEAGWFLGVRLVMFALFLAALGYCGYLLGSRMLRSINPYYAAHQLEQTVPDAKNSVINWLDLKEERLPPAIRASLGQRAAKDLKDADAEQVIDTRPNLLLGGVTAAFFLALVVIFALSPSQFGSLLARAFAPFRDVALPQRATITLIKPAKGDLTVPHGQRVEFVAQIGGRFPGLNQVGAPALLFRYNQNDVYQSRPLEEDPNGNWGTVLAPDLVQTGFWYRLSAGDASTPEHQVQVRSAPHAVRYEVSYRYRPYLLVPEETVGFPNEKAVFPEVLAHRGTEVMVTVRANQPVRDGKLQLEFEKTVKEVVGEPLQDDPKAFRCAWTLEKSGHFRVLFRSLHEENNSDRSPYRVHVIEDGVPIVKLTEPGKDVGLPANGTLALKGEARDDFGVKGLELRLRVLEGDSKPELAGKPYRPGKAFRFDTGGYPASLDYHEVVALEKLATAQGQALPLVPGMVLEYWLEATDNSDYPHSTGNVGKSQAYKIKIEPPQEDQKKQQEQRAKAEKEQEQHEQQQDKKQEGENNQKKQEAADAGKTPDEKQAADAKKKLDEARENLEKKLEEQEKQKNQGEAKGNEPDKAENKSNEGSQEPGASAKDNKDAKPDGKQPAGANKQEGPKNDGKNEAAQSKGANNDPKQQPDQEPSNQASQSKGANNDPKQQPNQESPSNQAAQPKNEGNDQKPPATAKGNDREDQNKSENQAADQNAGDKGTAKDQPKEQSGQAKDQGKQGDQGAEKQPGQAKNDSKDGKPDPKQGPQAKGGDNGKESPAPTAKNEKPEQKNNAGKKGESKPGSTQRLTDEKGSGKAKPDQAAKKGPADGDGMRRPAQAKGNEEPDRKSQAKGSSEGGKEETKQGPPATAKGQPEKKNLEPKGNAKDTPQEEAKGAATAKNDGDGKGGKQGPQFEPTMKDLERLKEQLEKNDPRLMKEASELAKNFPNIKDPQVRKQAEELMEKVGKKLDENQAPMPAKNTQPNDKGPSDQDGPMKNEPMTDPQGNEPQPMAQPDKSGKTRPKEGKQPNDAGREGSSGPGGVGPQDQLAGSEPNKSFADRLAELQLEDLMQRMTPEMRRAAGVSDEEWADFLKNSQAYERLRQKLSNQLDKKDVNEKRGAASQLNRVAPRRVQSLNRDLDPVTPGNALPPPELRDAQRRFTQPKAP